MFKEFQSFVNKEDLFNANEKILLGVSGGIDSVVMVELFSKSGFDFGIAHCNFRLRGQESNDDNVFVEKLSKKYHVPFYSKKFETTAFADKNSISIQMAARELRVKWFEELLLKCGYMYYATAHHLDDQIETLLNNYLRGTGISGLHGILAKRNNLIHPMLFCYRKQIEAFANQNQLIYRTDSSNKKTDYTRNQIRHQLIPAIKNIYPKYQKTITENIQRIRQIETIYNRHILEIVKELKVKNKEIIYIPIDKLLKLQPIETYTYELIKSYGFNYSNAVDIVNTIDSGPGKYFVSGTHKITIDRTELIIEKRNNTDQMEYQIEKDESFLVNPIKLKMQSLDKTSDFDISKNPHIANLDYQKLKYPLKLRRWKKGDYFYPLGMNQKKLISDFFIDNKISVPDKEKAWLLVSDEQIVWIVGYRIDNRYKINAQTKIILYINYMNK